MGLILNGVLAARPGRVSSELATKLFRQLWRQRISSVCLRLSVVAALALAFQILAAALPQPSIAAPGIWTTTFSLTNAREGHTATLLSNGKLLVAGGYNSSGLLDSAELFNFNPFYHWILGSTWPLTPPMETSRVNHTATLCPDGTVVLLGGANQYGELDIAEYYDPSRNVWYNNYSGGYNFKLQTARRSHTATRLDSAAWGAIFSAAGIAVIGGFYGNADGTKTVLASTEIYNYNNGESYPGEDLQTARYGHTATLLADGRILVAGGLDWGYLGILTSAEILDPTRGWSYTKQPMNLPRWGHTATRLHNGKVLIVGGAADNRAELYDPVSDTWSFTGPMAGMKFQGSTATLLPNGKVLVTGGNTTNLAELYDPVSNAWSTTGFLNQAREYNTATLLPTGQVLVVGGDYDGYLSSAELYEQERKRGISQILGLLLY